MIRSLILVPLSAVLAGCATVPLEASFREVQADVADERGHVLEWSGVTATPDALAQTIESMLEDGLTIEEAVRIAVLNNAELQAVYEDYGVARAELVAAGLLENPVLSGSVVFENSATQAWELELVQAFLSVLTMPLRRAVAKDELEQARLDILSASLDVAMDTRRAFLHYEADLQAFELLTQMLDAEEAAWELARRMREAGNISLLQLAEAQRSIEEARLNFGAAELDLEASRERVTRLMGLWGEAANWEAVSRLSETIEPLDLEAGYEREAIVNSLDLARAWLDIKLAARRAGIRNVEEIFPDFELGAKFESEEPETGDRDWEVGPAFAISLPIFNQGQAERAMGKASVRREWNLYTGTAVDVRSAARTAAYQVQVAGHMATYERDVSVPLARHIVDQALLEYNAMLIGPVALLEVKQAALETEIAYVRALLEYWLARTDLDQILMGRLVIRAPEDRPDIIGANVQRASEGAGDGH